MSAPASKRTWLAHGIFFDDEEIARLGTAGVGVVHCPAPNDASSSVAARQREAAADTPSRWAVLYRGFARLLPYVGNERMARGINALMRALGARGAYAESLPDGSAYDALPGPR